MFAGTLNQMWRYPVKGLRGETVRSAVIGPGGMAGDRVLEVLARGSGKSVWGGGHPRLMGWEAAFPAQCGCADGAEGAPVVYAPGGAAWAADDAGLPAAIAADVGVSDGVALRPSAGANERILVVFEASLTRLSEQLGREVAVERFRPNALVETDLAPFAEASLQPGAEIMIGGAAFTVQRPCVRCVLPGWDPFGAGERDLDLHRHVITELGNVFGVYLRTDAPVTVAVGDSVGGRLPAADDAP